MSNMMRLCLVGLAVSLLSGCVVVGARPGRQPTMGEQLIDLKAALDAEAITAEEYERLKGQVTRRQ